MVIQTFFNRSDLKSRRRALRNDPTVAERQMWHGLRKRRADGYKFRRQHSIGPFIADFYSPSLRLVVEIDGESHLDPDQQLYDTKRTAYFRSHSIDVIRFTNSEVLADVDACLERIVKFLDERGPVLRVTTP